MKRLIRSSEPREFRSAAGRAGPTVADMFDRLITWFTPERRGRFIFTAEIALGVLVAIGAILVRPWTGLIGWFFILVLSVGLGAAVAVHRRVPRIAPVGMFIGVLALSVPPVFGYSLNPWHVIALAIVVFGAAAYGESSARFIALGLSALVSAILLVVSVSGVALWWAGGITQIFAQGVFVVLPSMMALVPWLLGELLRNILNRQELSATVATVSTQRDAALTRADLEAERTRVARDVHDIVAHSLTVVIAQADGARYATAGDSPAAADAFETIAQTARDALADVRVLLTELRHTQEAGPQPGLDDLDALLQSMRDSGLALEVREFGDRGRLTESRELALYRIVQESLTNALRHGDGAATLELEWGEQAVDLVVTNAAAAETPESKDSGHGINGMRERASLAGGELSVHEGEVFRVRARLPLEPEVAEVLT